MASATSSQSPTGWEEATAFSRVICSLCLKSLLSCPCLHLLFSHGTRSFLSPCAPPSKWQSPLSTLGSKRRMLQFFSKVRKSLLETDSSCNRTLFASHHMWGQSKKKKLPFTKSCWSLLVLPVNALETVNCTALIQLSSYRPDQAPGCGLQKHYTEREFTFMRLCRDHDELCLVFCSVLLFDLRKSLAIEAVVCLLWIEWSCSCRGDSSFLALSRETLEVTP